MSTIVPENDAEIRKQDSICTNETQIKHPSWYNLKYLVVGILFGIVFVKAEIISWFRIQEMFRLQSFHMYGVIGSAVVVGVVSVFLIKKFNLIQTVVQWYQYFRSIDIKFFFRA